jgi:hypothetical protein
LPAGRRDDRDDLAAARGYDDPLSARPKEVGGRFAVFRWRRQENSNPLSHIK